MILITPEFKEENDQKIATMEESMKLAEEVQAEYQEVIRYAVLVLQKSLSQLTPNDHYSCAHIMVS